MIRGALIVLAAAAVSAGCASRPYEPEAASPLEPAGAGAAPAGSAAPPPPAAPPSGLPPSGPRQFHLGIASAALVREAHAQAAGGNSTLALATLERALRIEPDNPLLWIELGQVHEGSGNFVQADGMGRKALQLSAGDAHAQSAAWRLIAESLRARGRNPQASDAEARANALEMR